MLQIAICDDNFEETTHITHILEQYQLQRKAPHTEVFFSCDIFHNAADLLTSMSRKSYQILFLDILMPGLNGMDAAHRIRSFDQHLEIIFISSSPEYALEGYSVHARHYLIKPVTPKCLYPLLDDILREQQRMEDALTLQTGTEIVHIPYHRIEYIEVYNKKLMFQLSNDERTILPGTLARCEEQLLNRPEFIKVHRSYLVNMSCIHSLDSKEILTASYHRIPVSRLLYAAVRESYMQYLFQEKGVRPRP
ncbi:MAG: LytTR family DNA-binding domain-containing protein [Lachnospiraceae bacterium]|nr:LytTR family DNA-binding domain-containing protein [Lachnospiraceae bacterium]